MVVSIRTLALRRRSHYSLHRVPPPLAAMTELSHAPNHRTRSRSGYWSQIWVIPASRGPREAINHTASPESIINHSPDGRRARLHRRITVMVAVVLALSICNSPTFTSIAILPFQARCHFPTFVLSIIFTMRYSAVLMTVLSAASAALAQGTGDATFYTAGLGSCGFYNTDSDFIVALDVATMNAHSTGNPNTNPLCGKQIAITGPDGKTASATVVDTCPGCAPNSIDLSPAAFQQLASFDVGRLHGVTWNFVN